MIDIKYLYCWITLQKYTRLRENVHVRAHKQTGLKECCWQNLITTLVFFIKQVNITDTVFTSCSYRVHQCSWCSGDVVFLYIVSLWSVPQCKENHLKDIITIDHNDMTYIYRDKTNNIPTPECETSQQCLY